MAIRFLANTVGAAAMYMESTNASHVQTSGDQDTLVNLAWGPQHLLWQSSDTGARRIAYINKAGTLEANHVIIAGADSAVGTNVQILAYSTYSSSSTTIENFTSWNPALYGPKSRDYVEGLGTYSNMQAFEVYFSSTFDKAFPNIYFSKSLQFEEPIAITREPFWDFVKVGSQVFGVSERIQLAVTNVDDASIAEFNSLPRIYEQPLFIYDTDLQFLLDGLVQVVIRSAPTVKTFNQFHQLTFDMYVLRYVG